MGKSRSGDERKRRWEEKKTLVWPWKIISGIRYKAIFKTPILVTFILIATQQLRLG